MPTSQAVKLAREKRKLAQQEHDHWRERLILERALTPNVMRLAMMSGIIAYSTWAARSEHNVGPVQSALAFALPGIGIPLLAADAGIRDKYALAAIAAASVGYVTGQTVLGWHDAGVFPKFDIGGAPEFLLRSAGPFGNLLAEGLEVLT